MVYRSTGYSVFQKVNSPDSDISDESLQTIPFKKRGENSTELVLVLDHAHIFFENKQESRTYFFENKHVLALDQEHGKNKFLQVQ
jgi:hypothetical protein